MAHQLLDPPRQHPVRLGFGAAGLTFFFILLIAAADDIIANVLRAPLLDILSVLRILVLAGPVVVGTIAYFIARALRDNGGPTIGDLTRADLRTAWQRGAIPAHRGPAEAPAPAHPAQHTERVELWADTEEAWRWRYRAEATTLTSNETYLSCEEAHFAAATAYPQLRPELTSTPEHPLRTARRSAGAVARVLGKWGSWLILVAIALRRRRRRRE
jgi:ubiquinol-cytochrome c reductase cytochrome b subunit